MNYVIPTTAGEMERLGWDRPDVLLLTGDAFIDHPSFGSAVIARVLQDRGYRVAVADLLDADCAGYIQSFGRPVLFYGVSSGNVDSMVARYTSFKKIRNDDPYRPVGSEGGRPKRALIAYCSAIKTFDKETPIVIGGLEASMRRHIHYDYLDNKLRRSILLDTRADVLVYGMGEKPASEIADRLRHKAGLDGIGGTVIMRKNRPHGGYIELPDECDVFGSPEVFAESFKKIYTHADTVLVQKSTHRYLVQYPPDVLSCSELDSVYGLPYTRKAALKYSDNKIPALDMIHASITAHRGCASGCAFCSIALHQGRRIISRSEKSILKETKSIAGQKSFRGHITDIGGPSANMYGTKCASQKKCCRESCLYPSVCSNLRVDTKRWLTLLSDVSTVPGVSRVTLGSGIRYDLLMHDMPEALETLIKNHISGQLKIAPEHSESAVLDPMRKAPVYQLEKFVSDFRRICLTQKKKYYIIPYLMSNHPGSAHAHMRIMKKKMEEIFKRIPDQVQSFYPLPMTLSSVMYYTGKDPFTGESIFVERDMAQKRKQHEIFFSSTRSYRQKKAISKKKGRK